MCCWAWKEPHLLLKKLMNHKPPTTNHQSTRVTSSTKLPSTTVEILKPHPQRRPPRHMRSGVPGLEGFPRHIFTPTPSGLKEKLGYRQQYKQLSIICSIDDIRGVGVVTSDEIPPLTNNQSCSAMSATIFLSLTTFFSGNGHHSPPHPTISPNQQFLSQNQIITR
ncbi:hypothetical protein HanIR_Chr08g0350381 [Helianthus annuus]|nr:hypothetical protein HanIR_Chr08g0350381 [Helianthus annuus]